MVRMMLEYDFSKYEDIHEWVNDMFQSDLYLYIDDTTYIKDAHNGVLYIIETKYNYTDITYLLENDYKVRFWIVEDEEVKENGKI